MKTPAAFSGGAPPSWSQATTKSACESAAIPERDARARTVFKVEPRETGELTQLNLNEDLLRQMAVGERGRISARRESFRAFPSCWRRSAAGV